MFVKRSEAVKNEANKARAALGALEQLLGANNPPFRVILVVAGGQVVEVKDFRLNEGVGKLTHELVALVPSSLFDGDKVIAPST